MEQFKTEKEMFIELDNFIYKSKGVKSELRNNLISKINEFLRENKLDTDTHDFVNYTNIPDCFNGGYKNKPTQNGYKV